MSRYNLGVTHGNSMDGYENLENILPYEKARMDTEVYVPSNLLNIKQKFFY